MESIVRHGYDALLVLRAPGSAALVADTVFTKVSIDRITNSANSALDGRYGQRKFDVIVCPTAGFAAGSDNVYSLEFTSYDSAGANGVIHRTVALVAADLGKTLVYTFDCGTLAEFDADAAQFSINLNVTGGTPSATLHAWIAPEA